MHNPEQNKSEDYLERTRETAERESDLAPEEFDSAVKELTDRLTGEPWKKEGVMKFELPHDEGKEPAICAIDYDSSVDWRLKEHVFGDGAEKDVAVAPGYKKIKGLIVERGDDKLDLKDVLEKCSVYIYPQDVSALSSQERVGLDASENSGFVMSGYDPSTVLGLFVLIHEIGHFVDRESTPREKNVERILTGFKVTRGEELNVGDRASIIEQERNASAFFVKNMRKFIDKDTLEKISKIGIQRDVKLYHDSFEQ